MECQGVGDESRIGTQEERLNGMELYTPEEKGVLIIWNKLCIAQLLLTGDDSGIGAEQARKMLTLLEQKNESLIIRYINENPQLIGSVWSISKDKFNTRLK
jgi:hypothetical protein